MFTEVIKGRPANPLLQNQSKYDVNQLCYFCAAKIFVAVDWHQMFLILWSVGGGWPLMTSRNICNLFKPHKWELLLHEHLEVQKKQNYVVLLKNQF